MAPLAGASYTVNNYDVHTYLIKFSTRKTTAEAKVQQYLNDNDGCQDFIALKEYYEGTGVNYFDILKVEQIIELLQYSGERNPHMWWAKLRYNLILHLLLCTERRLPSIL